MQGREFKSAVFEQPTPEPIQTQAPFQFVHLGLYGWVRESCRDLLCRAPCGPRNQ